MWHCIVEVKIVFNSHYITELLYCGLNLFVILQYYFDKSVGLKTMKNCTANINTCKRPKPGPFCTECTIRPSIKTLRLLHVRTIYSSESFLIRKRTILSHPQYGDTTFQINIVIAILCQPILLLLQFSSTVYLNKEEICIMLCFLLVCDCDGELKANLHLQYVDKLNNYLCASACYRYVLFLL